MIFQDWRHMSKHSKKGLVPELRFPEFSGEVVWKQKRLNKISEIVMGSSPKSSAYNEVGIGLPLLQGNADIKNKLSAPRVFTSQVTKECRINDILLSVRAPVGTVAKSNHNACIGRGLSAIRAVNDNSQEFIYQWLLHFEPLWGNISQGGTFDAVNSDDIRHLLVPIPRKDEQQKVADCLSSLDELIAAHTQKHQALQSHKKGLMQNLFPAEDKNLPALRFPEFLNSGTWIKIVLGEVATFSKGKGISKSDVEIDGKLPCIRYGELYTLYGETIDEVVSFTNIPVETLVLSKSNDVIIPASGETQEDIATASCVKKEGVALGSDLNIIRSNINGVFLSYYLNSAKKHEIAQMAQGVSVIHLYPAQLRTLVIYLPQRSCEQQKIADCLSFVDNLITAQIQKVEELKLHKKGLMQQLFPSIDEVGA